MTPPGSSLFAFLGQRLGWWLMGLPTGWNMPSPFWLRCGPYRWGAWLMDRSFKA